MTGNDSGGRPTIPFGYQFIGPHAQTQHEHTSHAPSGPPLLEPSETNLLQNFFENPNNIDPSFLALSQERPEQSDAFNHTPQWMFGALQHDQGAPALPQTQSHSSPIPPFVAQQDASEDVYNAAKLLHSHQYQNGTFATPGFQGSPHAPPAPMYGYAQSQGNQGMYHSSPPERTSPASQSIYGTMMQGGAAVPAQRSEPLHFGSDNKFRETKYIGPHLQRPPEQDLMGILSAFSQDTEESPTQVRPASAGAPRRKRRRSSAVGSGAGDSDLEAGPAIKRSRIQPKAEDESDEEPNSSRSRAKKAAWTKAPGPAQRRKSSPGRKPTRENLTEEQKRSNHIQSEQKRRNLIKQGFEDTNRMVPELRAGGFSKSSMLQEAAKFMRELKEGNERLSVIVGLLDKG